MKPKMKVVKGDKGKRPKKAIAKQPEVKLEVDSAVVALSLQKKAAPISKKISSLVIKTEHDYESAAVLLKQLKDYAAEAKKKQDDMLDPLKLVADRIKNHFKPFLDSVKLIEKDTKDKMDKFLELRESAVQKVVNAFEEGKIAKPQTYLKKIKELSVTSSVANVAMLDTVEVVDISKIPREYMLPDLKAIKEALLAGKKVAGCKLTKTRSIRI